MEHFRRFLAGVVLLCLVACLAAPARADDKSKRLFRSAMNARDLGQWGLAAALFDEALKVDDREGELIRRQGTPWVPYLPHFHLGEVLFELEHYPEAFDQWRESVRQGALRKGNRRDIGRAIDEFEDACPGRLAEVHRAATRELEWIGRLRGRLPGEPTGPATDLAETRRTLDEQESALRSVLERVGETPSGSASPCARETGRVELPGRLERVLGSSRFIADLERTTADAREVLSRSERRIRAVETERALKKVDDALTEIRTKLEHGGPTAADLGQGPLRGLSPIRLAADGSSASGGDEALDRELAFADYLTAVGYVEARRCRQAIELLDRAEQHLDPSFSPPTSWGSFRYVPFVQRARAHMACPGPDAAARVTALRDRALELGRITPDEADGIDSWLRRKQAIAVDGGLSALLIGVSQYQNGHDTLSKVPQDLEALRGFLEGRGNVPVVLPDPTAEQMVEAIEQEISVSRTAEAPKRFLFYFSGHGDTHRTRQGHEVAYLVPVDAPREDQASNLDDYLQHQVVRIDQFLDWAHRLEFDQALFIFDSCFSGAIKGLTTEAGRPLRFDAESAQKPARLFIASGDQDQTVSAGSEFRETLIKGLSGCADSDDNDFVTGTELGDYVESVFETRRSSQHPWMGRLDDAVFGKGDFLLRIGNTSEKPHCPDDRSRLVAADVELWEQANDAFINRGDAGYLEIYTRVAPEHFFQQVVEFKLHHLAGLAAEATASRRSRIRRPGRTAD